MFPTSPRKLLRPTEAAAYLKLSPKTIDKWRVRGEGPKFIKVGGAVRYDIVHLDEYIENAVRRSTSETTKAA